MKKMSSYLVVAAHPDDEVLGAGGTMYKLSQNGELVNVCFMSADVKARNNRPDNESLTADIKASMKVLGVNQIYYGTFPNIKLNIVPHLDLVQFIEHAILETEAEIVITHHPSDLNHDHFHTSLACQEAVRLFQRKPGVQPLKELLFMEVPSATEWSLDSAMKRFEPNTFVEIGKQYLDKKIEALSCYRGVVRDYPHPRSIELITGLAAYRGGQAGLYYAEAFESVFRREC